MSDTSADVNHKPVIMVVEDNPTNMKLATAVLEVNGFQVLQAADGDTALRAMKAQRLDLVLLDIHLPGMDGYEVFRRIKADPALQDLKVIALTASALKEEEERIRNLGFTDYVSKPINTKLFIQTVRATIGG